MRRAAWFLAAAVAITAAVVYPAPAEASSRGDAWRMRAVTAYKSFRDSGARNAYTYAAMAEASGRLYGWASADATTYLSKVYALQQDDGGWGLGEAYDAFSDGSTNPADTTYAVTLADHVGPTLLAGYKAGVVPRSRVQGIVDLLVKLPRVPVAQGACVAYSDQAADTKLGLCVHNVNAGVAYMLEQAAAVGITTAGGQQLVDAITIQEYVTYQQAPVSWWAYRDGAPELQDADHEAYSAQSMALLYPTVGREAGLKVMANAYPDEATSPLAHMRLTSTPGDDWCALGDQWLAEAYTYITGMPWTADRWQRLAQSALFSARNAGACP